LLAGGPIFLGKQLMCANRLQRTAEHNTCCKVRPGL
jgi:hypothetical protein